MDFDTEPTSPDDKIIRKRGIRNERDYRRNVIKMARVKGASYTDWKGHDRAEVKQGEDCKYVNFVDNSNFS